MFAIASLAVLALALGARADLVIDTPDSITQCSPVTFQISGSTQGPYYAFVVNSNDPCGDALAEIDNISGSSFTWTANITAGTSVMIALESDDGTEGWSGAVTVGAGDSSCLGGSSTAPATTLSIPAPTTTHSTAHAASGTAPPVNAASDAAASTTTSGASRAVVGASSVLALLGAAVVAFSL